MALADFNHIKAVIAELDIQRPSRFGFTESAVSSTGQAEIDALTGEYIIDDGSQINSIPSAEMVGFDPIIIDIGLRTQAATAPRMALNHFFGRLSLNLLKLTDKLNLLVKDHLVHRYITPSGNVTEHITVSPQTDSVRLIQHQSPLSASEPVTASAAVTILAAVDDGNAGVMTGADKKSLTDLLSRTLTITGVKTFGSIPELPSIDPTTDNQAVRKAFVTAETARLISETLAAVEERKGFQVFTVKQSGVNCSFNKGILSVSEGLLGVDKNVLKIETAPEVVPISSDLTAGNWYIMYCDTTGTLTVELLTGATDYAVFPLTQLDTACPVEAKKVARYKSGDSTKRAIAIAYSLPALPAWDSLTEFTTGKMCTYNSSAWIALQTGTNQVPGVATTYWAEMGTPNRLFAPKIYNFPDEVFGTGELGDVTLDGTGLGATATPLYGIKERTLEDVSGTYDYELTEYNFQNLTLSGVCYCGNSNGFSCDPVIIRVKGTLTIESGGQLNGDSRGANGGAGGAGGTGAGSAVYNGGAGGAGAKSGRPILVYANRIINKRTSGYWITSQAGDASNGSIGGISYGGGGGGGGGGGASSSALTVITNSILNKSGINKRLSGKAGYGYGDGTDVPMGGAGATVDNEQYDIVDTAWNTRMDLTIMRGGFMIKNKLISAAAGVRTHSCAGGTTTAGLAGANSPHGGGGGSGGLATSIQPSTLTINGTRKGGDGGDSLGYGGAGAGGGAYCYNSSNGDTDNITGGDGGDGAAAVGGGGGGGGGAGYYSGPDTRTYTGTAGGAGSDPIVSHEDLGELLIIDNYSVRYGI